MPKLNGVSSLYEWITDLDALFFPASLVSASPTRVELVETTQPTTVVITGSNLTTSDHGFVPFGLGGGAIVTSGIVEELIFRDSATDALKSRISGLSVDIGSAGAVMSSYFTLTHTFAALKWNMTATTSADYYDLSDDVTFGLAFTGRNTLKLLGGDDTVTGGSGADTIDAGTGNDLIENSRGNDVVRGGLGDDQLLDGHLPLSGDDKLYGDIGNDTVVGGDGDDKLYGGAGDDLMRGGTGDDLMNGGKGRDTQDGGPGSDVFVFTSSDGADLITWFELAFDTLRIAAASVRISEVDGDAVLKFGTTTITLESIAKADLVLGDHYILV